MREIILMFGVEAAWCLDINGDDDFKEEFRSIKIIETANKNASIIG